MIDQLRQMAIFAKAIDHGSFRGAAKELNLSPSVVSHHISQLEEQLGVALIYRSTRKLSLTREGQRLLVATRAMLEAVQGELHALSAEADQPSGELHITAPSVLSQSPFTDMVADFLKAHPRIGLTLDFSDERKNIIDGGFDLAIRMGLTPRRSAATRRLFRVQRKLVASPSLLRDYSSPKSPEALEDLPWIELSPLHNTPTRFRNGEIEQFVQRKSSRLSCNDAHGLYRLALSGAGLAMVPEFLATQDVADGRMVFLLPEWELDPIHVYADWPANAPKNGLIRLLVDNLSSNQRSV